MLVQFNECTECGRRYYMRNIQKTEIRVKRINESNKFLYFPFYSVSKYFGLGEEWIHFPLENGLSKDWCEVGQIHHDDTPCVPYCSVCFDSYDRAYEYIKKKLIKDGDLPLPEFE